MAGSGSFTPATPWRPRMQGRQNANPFRERLTDARTLLVASSHFVLERIDLSSKSNWELHAGRETWLFVLEGHARIGLMNAFAGEAMFLEAEDTSIKVGAEGMKGLLAYLATEPSTSLLQRRRKA